MRHKVIAVCGKGGAGKTTVSAIIAGALFKRKDRKALMIDADPAGGLGMALGIPVKRSLEQVRAETIAAVRKGKGAKKDLAMSVDYLLMNALTEKGNLAFLSIGRPEELGCYCPVNSLLRDSIEILADQFDLVVIDAEAGMEQVNRKVMSAVNYLALVSDTSAKGIKVAETIGKVAGKVSGQNQAGLLLNRVRSEDELREILARTKLELIGWIPEDERIRQFDREGLSFFDLPAGPADQAVIKAMKRAKILS